MGTVGDQPVPVTWTLLSYDTAENLLTAKKQNQLKSFRIKMDILKFFMIILPFASTMTLPEQIHQNELAVAASEDWVLLPLFYLLQAADFLGSLVSGVSHQLTRAALFL